VDRLDRVGKVGDRKALLIGAENYGDGGFPSLPAVRRDIELMQEALTASGYEATVCNADTVRNAGELDKKICDFCKSGTADDIRLLYFSGHGLLANNSDWIIPAGTSRQDAARPTQRVATDLSNIVADSKVGLVLFIIDACRDPVDSAVTKGAGGQGEWIGIANPSEGRFARYFGCAANQVCQVMSGGVQGDQPTSLFTRALAATLRTGDAVSLGELMPAVERRCEELSSGSSIKLKQQVPHLSYGELSGKKQGFLEKPIFDPVGRAALPSVWEAFDPNDLQCLVVLSEYEHERLQPDLDAADAEPVRGVTDIVRDATNRYGEGIWKSFAAACNGEKLASGKRRAIANEYAGIKVHSFSVLDAFGSEEALDKATRAVVEADLAVFDVTGFEPGIMLLIGIRAACRRAVAVCSHGAGWKEGQPLEVPFNLQGLNISFASHTPWEVGTSDDPVVKRLAERMQTGFDQLARHPAYLDLPAYDALRQLGPELEASSTIDIKDRILVLCSYSEEFFSNWMQIQSGLSQAITAKLKRTPPKIQRIIDYGSPQLIWQTQFEYVRRTAGCVVDWSEYNPSVFLELGVRLAVSPWGAIQIIDDRYWPGTKLSDAERAKLTPNPAARLDHRESRQIHRLDRLFKPIRYRRGPAAAAAFDRAAADLLQRRPTLAKGAEYNRIHRCLQPIVETVQKEHSPVYRQLKNMADALHHPDQDREAISQIIFSGSRGTKLDSKLSALEMRIAAWLYLEHRTGIARLADDSERQIYDDLGRAAKDALYDLINEESIASAQYAETLTLAGQIEDRLEKIAYKPDLDLFGQVRRWQADARSYRKKGDALRKAGNTEEANKAFNAGVAVYGMAIDQLKPQTPQVPPSGQTLSDTGKKILDELVETYGAQGGLLQRRGSLSEAAASYSRGAELERAFALPSTYNRLNEVKCSLLSGAASLAELKPRIGDLAEFIKQSLPADKNSSDSGWVWADLGDCLALLGRVDEALDAYSTFIAKAEIKSLERTLDILRRIAAKIADANDLQPLQAVMAHLQDWLAGKTTAAREVRGG
jgi:tetratricopeptide (TPR) repeat protein